MSKRPAKRQTDAAQKRDRVVRAACLIDAWDLNLTYNLVPVVLIRRDRYRNLVTAILDVLDDSRLRAPAIVSPIGPAAGGF